MNEFLIFFSRWLSYYEWEPDCFMSEMSLWVMSPDTHIEIVISYCLRWSPCFSDYSYKYALKFQQARLILALRFNGLPKNAGINCFKVLPHRRPFEITPSLKNWCLGLQLLYDGHSIKAWCMLLLLEELDRVQQCCNMIGASSCWIIQFILQGK